MRSRIVYLSDTLDNAPLFKSVLARFDASVSAGSTLRARKLLQPNADLDLVIFEARGAARLYLSDIVSLVEDCKCALLLITDEASIDQLIIPTSIASDFIVHGAGQTECTTRIMRLLGGSDSRRNENLIRIDSMVINLDTYQVTVGNDPIDFTYLEYALLAFLVRHADRTFSREALLQQIWSVNYAGGSRTVDVHVRRIRSKLGPNLSQHLETIRGVGYLWNSK